MFQFAAVWQTRFSDFQPSKKLSVFWKVPQVNKLQVYLKITEVVIQKHSYGWWLSSKQTHQRGLCIVSQKSKGSEGDLSHNHTRKGIFNTALAIEDSELEG